MASFNRVMLLGNLTRDPQLKYLPSQTPVAEFGLATNRKFRTGGGEDREEVCFVDCTAFGRQAEVINQYCHKGNPLFIEGRLKYDQWEDKQGGGKRSKLTVVIENFQLLGGRQGGGGGDAPAGEEASAPPRYSNRPPAQRSAPQQAPAQQAPAQQAPSSQEPPFGDEQQFGDNDIPF
jgi:single-strand DNA-binding protein